MDIIDADIGGARVRRVFSRGSERLAAGRILSADDVISIPVANRRALVSAGYIEIFPRAPLQSVGERHIVHLGGGRYDIIQGVKLNAEPLSKDDAEELATRPAQ